MTAMGCALLPVRRLLTTRLKNSAWRNKPTSTARSSLTDFQPFTSWLAVVRGKACLPEGSKRSRLKILTEASLSMNRKFSEHVQPLCSGTVCRNTRSWPRSGTDYRERNQRLRSSHERTRSCKHPASFSQQVGMEAGEPNSTRNSRNSLLPLNAGKSESTQPEPRHRHSDASHQSRGKSDFPSRIGS